MWGMTKLMEQLLAEAAKLPDDEQDTLATFWFSDVRGEALPEDLKAELDRRLKEHEEHPEDVLTWEEVQDRIRQRRLA